MNSAAMASVSAGPGRPSAIEADRGAAGIKTAGTPEHSAALAASPASGPAVTIRSAASAACAIAWANSTGRVTWPASSRATSSSGVIRRPVMVETSRRRGGPKLVPAKTLRSGTAHPAMPGECIGVVPRPPSSTSTGTPSIPARLVSSRMPAVDPASTCVRGPSQATMCRRPGAPSVRAISASVATRAIAAVPQAQARSTWPHWATRRAASAVGMQPAQASPVISARP